MGRAQAHLLGYESGRLRPRFYRYSRSPGAGIVAMLPNVLPVFVIFGSMGWLNISVDIGSMMTASIALGVAVDDTIHYLSWYRIELNACAPGRANSTGRAG